MVYVSNQATWKAEFQNGRPSAQQEMNDYEANLYSTHVSVNISEADRLVLDLKSIGKKEPINW